MVYSEKAQSISSQQDDDSESNEVLSLSSGSGSNRTGFTGDRRSQEDEHADKEMRDKIIRREEQAVKRARIVVICAIIAAAVAVSTSIYVFAAQADYHNFELVYEGYVKDIVSLVQWEVTYNFALMQQMSASVTSTAAMIGATFPNLTQPSYEVSGGYVDGMGGIMSCAFAPLVTVEQRDAWEEYAFAHQGWLAESKFLKTVHPGHRDPLHNTNQDHEHDRRLQKDEIPPIAEHIFRWVDGEKAVETDEPGKVFAPLWQVSPASAEAVNSNLLADERIVSLYKAMVETDQSLMSQATPIEDLFDFQFDPEEKQFKVQPHAFLMEPVYEEFAESPSLVGFLVGLTSFGNLFNQLLPADESGIICVVRDSCGRDITFRLEGPMAEFLGYEDLHDPAYDAFENSTNMEFYKTVTDDMCVHTLYIYPSAEFQAAYMTNKPAIYTSVVALAFLVTAVMIVIYDVLVTRRQAKTMKSALRANKFVSSLFPANVRDRIMDDGRHGEEAGKATNAFSYDQNDVTGDDICNGLYKTRPIADFFPNTTVMFADISGFTAWSSTREPFQVFLLLETLYGAFDQIAKRRRVFKVETVGDCYVAVAGVPTARKDHALAMARFARDCLNKMIELTSKLEVTLGPDTTELAFRVGLHSGPVTGGVLRGENARFQLFGDTMNTAARMESTGTANRIQVSATTAQLIEASGKGHWLKQRSEGVVAKGKGRMDTYWLAMERDATASVHSSSQTESTASEEEEEEVSKPSLPDTFVGKPNDSIKPVSNGFETELSDKALRLVDWNAAVLLQRIKAIAMQRSGSDELDPEVATQLRSYVAAVATKYNDNRFHSFDHASHVTMSVTKLLARVVTAEDSDRAHLYTKSITSDPLLAFAVVLSALIHDVDHQGVPNVQLAKENAPVAAKYDKSIAENNSIVVAWDLLMKPEFNKLRACVCPRRSDLLRLHELVTNTVLATDIVDKELKEDRNARWKKVFSESASGASNIDTLKATIVLEHMIQASDVCHTMQHWHIYRKWNERLFEEMYKAYIDGRAEKNPAEFWYKGEIGFFDFYIIPLAEKLSECGVFGVSSDEFLNYARSNRREWEEKGQAVVEALVEKFQKQYADYKPTEAAAAPAAATSKVSAASLLSANNDAFACEPLTIKSLAKMSVQERINQHLTRAPDASSLLFL